MQHLPDICISICGAAVLVAAVLVWPAWRTMRRGWDYVRVQDVPDGNGWL